MNGGTIEVNSKEELQELIDNGNLDYLDHSAKPKTEKHLVAEKPKATHIELPFWEKLHVIERRHLAVLIIFALIGAGFLAYEIYLHWLISLFIGVGSGLLILAIRKENES